MMTETKAPLVEALLQYTQAPRLPFHMPGHKAGRGAHPLLRQAWGDLWQWDLTEIAGLDNLGAPEGILGEAQEMLADYRHAARAFFLPGGATLGLQAAILACCKPGDKVILPRHAHMSLWSGVALAGAIPIWLPVTVDPQSGLTLGVDPAVLAAAIARHPEAKAVVWVHPTSHGLTCGLAEARRLTAAAGMMLLVDGAHGSHFMALGEPLDPVAMGADVVVESWHKTMGSLTQTAVLLQQNNELNLEPYLRLLCTSSPSYPLMASLDGARAVWQEHQTAIIGRLRDYVEQVHQTIDSLSQLTLLTIPGQDPTRLLLAATRGHTGYQVAELLRRAGVEPELADQACVVLFVTIGDREDTIIGLCEACRGVDQQLAAVVPEPHLAVNPLFPVPEQVILPQQALRCDRQQVLLADGVQRVAAQAVAPYPPGIPMVGPGERITKEIVCLLQDILTKGGAVQGLAAAMPPALWVIKNGQ